MTIYSCKLIDLPTISNNSGKLGFVENTHLPFNIERVFYMYDVPTGTERGGHAHKSCQQFIIMLAGGCLVKLDDGRDTVSFYLTKPTEGLYVDKMIWTNLYNFWPNSVCLVLASDSYKETDYYRIFEEFLKGVENGNSIL